jgi:hypothetical protein
MKRPHHDLAMTYKIRFGTVKVNMNDFYHMLTLAIILAVTVLITYSALQGQHTYVLFLLRVLPENFQGV